MAKTNPESREWVPLDPNLKNILANPTQVEIAQIYRIPEEERMDWARRRAVQIAQESGYSQEDDKWVRRLMKRL